MRYNNTDAVEQAGKTKHTVGISVSSSLWWTTFILMAVHQMNSENLHIRNLVYNVHNFFHHETEIRNVCFKAAYPLLRCLEPAIVARPN